MFSVVSSIFFHVSLLLHSKLFMKTHETEGGEEKTHLELTGQGVAIMLEVRMNVKIGGNM